MTRFELIEISRELIQRIKDTGIRMDDVEYVGMYKDYLTMKNNNKKTYVVAVLAEKYNTSVRTVYNVIKRFEKECSVGAV